MYSYSVFFCHFMSIQWLLLYMLNVRLLLTSLLAFVVAVYCYMYMWDTTNYVCVLSTIMYSYITVLAVVSPARFRWILCSFVSRLHHFKTTLIALNRRSLMRIICLFFSANIIGYLRRYRTLRDVAAHQPCVTHWLWLLCFVSALCGTGALAGFVNMASGLPPCTQCPQGSYAQDATSCQTCPTSETTNGPGAANATECQGRLDCLCILFMIL